MYKLGVGSVFIALYLPLGVLFNRDTVISPEFNVSHVTNRYCVSRYPILVIPYTLG